MTREAVEFVRDTLAIERVCIYLVESAEPQLVMRGTWGTSDRGSTTDERGLAHMLPSDEVEALRSLHKRGQLWLCHLLEKRNTDRRRLPWTVEDRSWFAITPLMFGREIVAVFYNDSAISHAPLDPSKQEKLAVFGSLLVAAARDRLARLPAAHIRPAVPKTSRFIHKVLYDLEREPQLSGEQLAERFRVSAGHLSRMFKAEVGTSLVEYRNRLRLDRFFALMQAGGSSVQDAAIQAGFGSYAQFLHVHRQVTGVLPREYASNVG
ncbi:MAG: AraC family transcriptional regulator [Polyangiaceae bacterium]